ncbi:MAG: serine/threonine protein kinase [Planctomycetota bacterium]|jgi:serine/threonine protein kinase
MGELRNSIFGTLVLQTGLVSKEQIIECLKYQKTLEEQGKKVPRLGELMASKGYLTVDQVKDILKKQKDLKTPQQKTKKTEEEIGAALQPGREFADYQVINRLGSDANGITAKAKNTDTDKTVSLRVLTKEAMRNNEYVQLFEEHALKAAKLDHPNIVKILAAGSYEGRLYQVGEFIEGVSFRRLLDAKNHLETTAAVEMAFAVLNALECSHARGIFHRHLSPSCIIVLPDKSIKVAGFGSVPRPIEDLEELTNTAGDTPFYIAPEQADKSEKVYCDARTDIYSLGCILYHSLTGTPPFHGSSIEEVLLKISEEDVIPISLIKEDLPAELSELVQKMLSLDPEDRFQSAAEVKSELEKIKLSPDAEAPAEKQQIKDTAGLKSASGKSKRQPKTATRATRTSKTSKKSPAKPVSRARQKASQKGSSNAAVYAVVAVIFLAIIGAIVYFALNKQQKSKATSQNAYQTADPTAAKKKADWKRAPSLSQGKKVPRSVVKKSPRAENTEPVEREEDEEPFAEKVEEKSTATAPARSKPVRREEQKDIDPEVLRRRRAIQGVLND